MGGVTFISIILRNMGVEKFVSNATKEAGATESDVERAADKEGFLSNLKKKLQLLVTLSATVGTFLASEGISEKAYADDGQSKGVKSHETTKSAEVKSPISLFAVYLDKITAEAVGAYDSVKTEEQAEAFCKKYFDPVIEKYQRIQEDVIGSPIEEIKKLESSATKLADLSHKLHNDPRFGDAVSEKDQPRRRALYTGVEADITASRLLREIRQINEDNILNALGNLENRLRETVPGYLK